MLAPGYGQRNGQLAGLQLESWTAVNSKWRRRRRRGAAGTSTTLCLLPRQANSCYSVSFQKNFERRSHRLLLRPGTKPTTALPQQQACLVSPQARRSLGAHGPGAAAHAAGAAAVRGEQQLLQRRPCGAGRAAAAAGAQRPDGPGGAAEHAGRRGTCARPAAAAAQRRHARARRRARGVSTHQALLPGACMHACAQQQQTAHAARHQQQQHASCMRQPPSLGTPAPARSYFYATLSLGSPARRFSTIIDTGSTMTYIPCADCKHCGHHTVRAAAACAAACTARLRRRLGSSQGCDGLLSLPQPPLCDALPVLAVAMCVTPAGRCVRPRPVQHCHRARLRPQAVRLRHTRLQLPPGPLLLLTALR